MAFLGLKVPHETARLLSEIEVPGTREAPSSFHITMLYLGSDVSIDVLAEAIKTSYGVTSKTKPFTVSTSLVTTFPGSEDGIPVICKVNSEPLLELRQTLAEAFDAADVPFNKKYPKYQPHVTLAYSQEPYKDRDIPTVEWGAHELVLWGGNDGDRKLVVTFPFSLNVIASRVAHRFLSL